MSPICRSSCVVAGGAMDQQSVLRWCWSIGFASHFEWFCVCDDELVGEILDLSWFYASSCKSCDVDVLGVQLSNVFLTVPSYSANWELLECAAINYLS
ncbi:hypothetical protein AKJ16_DCAP02964 [Drosera capensis]